MSHRSHPIAIAATLLAFAVAASAFAQEAAPEPIASVPEDRLPLLGVVGDFPPAEESLVLEIGAEGDVHADGKALDEKGLILLMVRRAAEVRAREGRPSTCVVLRVDRDASWAAVMRIQSFCMADPIKTLRLFFAARSAGGGPVGAVAAFGLRPDPWEPRPKDVPELQFELRAESGNDAPVGASFQDFMSARFMADWVPSVRLDIHPDVSVGAVLEVSDALLLRGVRGILFMPATQAGPVKRGVARPRILLHGKPIPPVPPPDGPRRHPKRRTGSLVGSFGYPGTEEGGPPPGFRPARLFVSTPRLPVFAAFDAPPPEGAVVVDITPRPTLRVLKHGKQGLSLIDLQALLRRASEGKYEEEEPRASKVDVVIRADGDCRWQDIQWVLQACADPEVRVYRTRFAGRSPGDGVEGSVACFLPTDVKGEVAASRQKITVRLKRGSESADSEIFALERRLGRTGNPAAWDSLRDDLKAVAARDRGLLGEIDADAEVPYREAMAVLDAFRVAGMREVRFRGTRLSDAAPPKAK